MTAPYTMTGVLSDNQTVILDAPLPMPTGRVRVIVEVLSMPNANISFVEKLKAIHQSLQESGYLFRTKAEVDAQIKAERDSWDD